MGLVVGPDASGQRKDRYAGRGSSAPLSCTSGPTALTLTRRARLLAFAPHVLSCSAIPDTLRKPICQAGQALLLLHGRDAPTNAKDGG